MKISDPRLDDMIRKKWSLVSQGHLARTLGVSRGTIAYRAKKMGLDKIVHSNCIRWADEETKLLVRLWNEGELSSAEIARRIGRSHEAVKSKSKKLNLPSRDTPRWHHIGGQRSREKFLESLLDK